MFVLATSAIWESDPGDIYGRVHDDVLRHVSISDSAAHGETEETPEGQYTHLQWYDHVHGVMLDMRFITWRKSDDAVVVYSL